MVKDPYRIVLAHHSNKFLKKSDLKTHPKRRPKIPTKIAPNIEKKRNSGFRERGRS